MMSDIKFNKELNWPNEVPLLTEDDFIRGTYHSGDDSKHCLLGHIFKSFPDSQVQTEVQQVMLKHLRRSHHVRPATLPTFNDDPKVPLSKLAKVWNTTMKLLGYDKKVYE